MGVSKLIKAAPEYKRVMGVDCSTESFAFAIFEDGKLVKWGEVKFNGKTALHRLADGQTKVRAMKDILNADRVVVESAIYVQNKKTVILLAYALGAIIGALINSGSVVDEIAPVQWQRFIGNPPLTRPEKDAIMKGTPGKSASWYSNQFREARKARTKAWVREKFAIDVDSDNVSDAIGVGWYGLHGGKNGR
jgi:hypothetical protein